MKITTSQVTKSQIAIHVMRSSLHRHVNVHPFAADEECEPIRADVLRRRVPRNTPVRRRGEPTGNCAARRWRPGRPSLVPSKPISARPDDGISVCAHRRCDARFLYRVAGLKPRAPTPAAAIGAGSRSRSDPRDCAGASRRIPEPRPLGRGNIPLPGRQGLRRSAVQHREEALPIPSPRRRCRWLPTIVCKPLVSASVLTL